MTLTSNQYDVLNRFARGAKPGDIAFALGLRLPEVNATLALVNHDPARATKMLAGDDTRTAPAAETDAGDVFAPTEDPAPDAAPPGPRTLKQLLDAGDTSTDKRTRAIAARARELVDELATRVDEEEAERRAAEEAERQRADTRARLERLQEAVHAAAAELAALDRKPRPKVGTESATSRAGLDARRVRTWAAAAGMQCKPTGRVPAAVVEAYLAAQGGRP